MVTLEPTIFFYQQYGDFGLMPFSRGQVSEQI